MDNKDIIRVIEPECHLWGEFFSPKLLHSINNIEFRAETELGEIMTRGRYKGRTAPCGSCELITPLYVELSDRIMWMAEFIFMNKQKLVDAGATEIMFWIYWSDMQRNVAFTPRELKMISKTDVPLCIDYVQLDKK